MLCLVAKHIIIRYLTLTMVSLLTFNPLIPPDRKTLNRCDRARKTAQFKKIFWLPGFSLLAQLGDLRPYLIFGLIKVCALPLGIAGRM